MLIHDVIGFFAARDFGWLDVVDIQLVAFIIYELLQFIRGTHAVQMALGGLVLVVLYWASKSFDLETVNWLLRTFLPYVVFGVIVVFQAEIPGRKPSISASARSIRRSASATASCPSKPATWLPIRLSRPRTSIAALTPAASPHDTIAPSPSPSRKHQVSLYLRGQWHTLTARPAFSQGGDSLARLDVTLLQLVLGPLFGIEDPRRSERIGFVGGGRGTAELERLVDSGAYACAFAMYPTSIGDLMAIADAGAIMPPKSTWFEPKLREAMFCHRL